MAPGFGHLRPHRRLIGFLEAGLDCLEEALSIDNTLVVLPHWACGQLRTMAEDLSDLLERVARESPVLGPLRDDDAEGP